ncbi:MAG TPA: DUF4091 domain-containing protein [Polyangiaceae bacterium]|jgi:hypothetical protein
MLLAPRVWAAPRVWVVDDGEKVRSIDLATPFAHGEDNPVWQPGAPVRLFAMRNESVALQVVVEADDDALDGVTVDLDELHGPGEAVLANREPRTVPQPIERFVEHFTIVQHPSGRAEGEGSQGWEDGSGPAHGAWLGPVPDALIPVEVARSWDPYPMHVLPRTNRLVWIDLNVPRTQAAGAYAGSVLVHAAGSRELATIPVELEVADATLPDRTVGTAVHVDLAQLEERSGRYAERGLWQLLHAHRITPLHEATTQGDVQRQADALNGSLFTRATGYVGPGAGLGDGVLALGAAGALEGPDDGTLHAVEGVVAQVSYQKLFGSTEVILFAADEQCESPWGAGWRALLRGADDQDVRRVRVGWRCPQDPTAQPVDVPILHASWNAAEAKSARAQGKETWVYGGVLPRTGTFLLDANAVSPRVNGWLSAMFGIPRWDAGDAMRWSRGQDGDEPIDPFEEPETYQDGDGAWAEGEGLLVYPGTQLGAFQEHSLGVPGVVPSIRLKNWRRGIEDAGYLQMARERDPAAADAVARWLIPAAFGEATAGGAPSWSPRGRAFFEARRALLAIALGREPVALAAPAGAARSDAQLANVAQVARGSSTLDAEAAIVLALAGIVGMRLLRRRQA